MYAVDFLPEVEAFSGPGVCDVFEVGFNDRGSGKRGLVEFAEERVVCKEGGIGSGRCAEYVDYGGSTESRPITLGASPVTINISKSISPSPIIMLRLGFAVQHTL